MLEIEGIKEIPGKIVRGFIHLIDNPTGSTEKLAVVIASGKHDGPTFLLTANIHGDEIVGVVIIHRVLENIDLENLHGRIVAFPSLNPTGHLLSRRYPVFDPEDPNRKWPDSNPKSIKKNDNNTDDYLNEYYKRLEPSIQERIWERIFGIFKDIKPDFHIDLHTFSNQSIPFIYLDRVLYENNRDDAEKLYTRVKNFVDAIGLTVIVENPAKRYVNKKLHRSTSGATLNGLRIPSCTIELGPMNSADNLFKSAGYKAVMNALIHAKMLDQTPNRITEVPVIRFKENYRDLPYPQSPATGILDIIAFPGQEFSKGDTLAIIRSISGERLAEIKAEMNGFVIGWWNGIAKYKGELIGSVAVEDKLPMVVSWNDINKEK